jgi:hypothetical protein
MANPKKEKERVITIDDVDYKFDDMTDEAKMLVNHVGDLDNKIGGARFNLDQLNGGREYFMDRLNKALGHEPPEVAEVVQD